MSDAEELQIEFIAAAEDADATRSAPSTPAPAAVSEDEPLDEAASSPEISEEDAAEGESAGQPYTHMGVRFVVRSAEGTKVINTIDVLQAFELSV